MLYSKILLTLFLLLLGIGIGSSFYVAVFEGNMFAHASFLSIGFTSLTSIVLFALTIRGLILIWKDPK